MAFDPGSSAPAKRGVKQIVMASTLPEQAELSKRSLLWEKRFRVNPVDDMHAFSLLIPNLHSVLYADLSPEMPEAVGTYRGTVKTPLVRSQRVVITRGSMEGLRKVDHCSKPEQVIAQMVKLTRDIQIYWQAPDRDTAHSLLTQFTFRFLFIHPFLDGNGHVWRLAMIALARRAGIEVSKDWTVKHRPYGPHFSYALQNYREKPELLSQQLSVFFK